MVGAKALRREIAFTGQRVKRKVLVALILASVIPLLLLTYALQTPTRSLLGPVGDLSGTFALTALLLFSALLIAGGGFVVWDIASAISRAAQLATTAKASDLPSGHVRQDEIGTLVDSFGKMLVTIEQQTDEINQFPRRLDQLARQAFRDPLTGLPNRSVFVDRLALALTRTERRGELLAVLFLDLDRFKVINDGLGHSAGDQLLIGLSQRLTIRLRPEDTIARLGSDEFAVLLEDVKDASAVTEVAERLGAEMQQPFLFQERELFITASIGIALTPPRGTTPEEILRNAELAMHHAKARGKARYELFDTSMNGPGRDRLGLELDLRHAISHGDFTLHYQPVLAFDSRRIAEVEALVRWNHPQRGLLFPADFVGLTEETGLIVPLGRWITTEACRQLRKWQTAGEGAPLVMSVNLSARQLQHPHLVDDVATALEETRIVKQLGVHLAIDDFGTGYSSLGYLKRFPVDTLKIDRSFVNGIGRDVEDTAIVRAVITVAKSLGLAVTAEGIESEAQLGELRALGCDRGQGYLFARPVPADRIPPLLAAAPWARAKVEQPPAYANGSTTIH